MSTIQHFTGFFYHSIIFSALIAKVGGADGTDVNYVVTVTSTSISLMYLPRTGGSGVRTLTRDGLDLSHAYWHHLAVTVFEEDAAFYINGSVVGVMALVGPILDNPLRDIKLGQISSREFKVKLHCGGKVTIIIGCTLKSKCGIE